MWYKKAAYLSSDRGSREWNRRIRRRRTVTVLVPLVFNGLSVSHHMTHYTRQLQSAPDVVLWIGHRDHAARQARNGRMETATKVSSMFVTTLPIVDTAKLQQSHSRCNSDSGRDNAFISWPPTPPSKTTITLLSRPRRKPDLAFS